MLESPSPRGLAGQETPLIHLAVRQAISGELLTTETVSSQTTARMLKEKLRRREDLRKSRLKLLLPGMSQTIEEDVALATLAVPPVGTSAEAPLVLQVLQLQGSHTALELTHSFSSTTATARDHKKPILYKIILVGPAQVGKTWLLTKYLDSRSLVVEAPATYRPTVGPDFVMKRLRVDEKFAVALQIWDIPGEDRFRGLSLQVYRGTDACLFVFDLTSRSSFDEIKRFHDEFLASFRPREVQEGVQLILVGNNADLAEQRVVSTAEAEDFAAGLHLKYVEVSARADPESVRELFEGVTSLLLDHDQITRDG